ncbi:circularly permuted type 2 ATP-grasp protein [Anatilimnocola sp. NA78]|uniref:circularly permuted type 2 ATP-grasp protein n=1 Tax=Anatilimnocola sp. NA78 TaxID=3415683 RepID=UPI003CE468C7
MLPGVVANDSQTGRDLLKGYQPYPHVHDELLSPEGTLRSHWQKFMPLLGQLGSNEIARRWEQSRRVIRENGVTYNVHGDPAGLSRPWELDAIPLLLPATDWKKISEGLIQRATLLNLVLADLYGPQRLLAEGLLPPELVFAHPGFLRPCKDLPVPRNRYLYLSAVHLTRDRSGEWLVIADRTRGPTGAGYALENRLVMSRMLPDVFRDCQVERLARFFATLRETLQAGARNQEQPRTVLLSPGPTSPTYFEDAYLSRYLGFALVEGGDLTVRENQVYLKTLGGLLRVDVILRRVRDENCDALELRGDSIQGVPGLTHAARSGNVLLANALGSSVVESAALVPFLPTLARFFLREELKLPSVRTWWCGDGESLQYVTENFDKLVVKPSFPIGRGTAVSGAMLAQDQRREWLERIKARPQDYVAQDLVTGSSAPMWAGGSMRACHVAVRTFAVASGDGYEVMPGGLARVSTSSDPLAESALGGQGSKDVWVLADGPVNNVSLLHPAGTPVSLQRSGNDLPSRVADHLFWLGRHVERLEGTARVLRTTLTRLTSETTTIGSHSLGPLLKMLADLMAFPAPLRLSITSPAMVQIETELGKWISDPARNSLTSMANTMRSAATVVRDRLSLDSWRILNRLGQELTNPGRESGTQLADSLPMLNRLILDLAAFSGMGTESMTRGPGWRFLDLGRRLERSLQAMTVLKVALVEPPADEDSLFEALLEIADSSMTYRNRYLTTLQLPPLLDLLLTDETNPRSVAFQAVALQGHVDSLPHSNRQLLLSTEQRLVLDTCTQLRLADVFALSNLDRQGRRSALERFLQRHSEQLRMLSDEISRNYLIHAGPSRQLNEIRPSGRVV